MTTRVNFDSNIHSVINSIDDVKDDIPKEMEKRVGAAMRVLWADAKQYVLNDPHHTGSLFQSLQNDTEVDNDGLQFSVYTDASIAPYAAIVEFGSGSRSDIGWRGSARGQVPFGWPNGPADSYPPSYPFESPSIDFDHLDPFNTEPFPKFYGFAKHIEDWMRSKSNVQPKTGDYYASAILIAATIIRRGNYAHPFLRPAWFDNELNIKRAARHALKNAVR